MSTGRRHELISSALAAGGGVVLARSHPSLRRTLLREVERGTLASPMLGTFVAAGTERDPLILATALCAFFPDAVVTGWTAAAMSFWPGEERLPIRALQVKPGNAPAWLAASRASVPPELIVSRGPVRLTCPELTALDLAAESGGESVFALLRSGAGSIEGLNAVLALLPRRRGNAARGRALGRAANNPWSGGEQQFQRLLMNEQLAEFVGNLRVRVFGRTYRVDLALERLKIGIEFDSAEFHTDRKTFEDDRRKHNDLEAAGWRILHVTWEMLVGTPDETLRRIHQLIARVQGS
jgi:very-short-patch-repair endonuclease